MPLDGIPFKQGTYTESDANSTLSVTLTCTSGCECTSNAQCDDGRECTRDSCVQGNCVNTPDDLIKPQQVAGDCLSCVNGEVQSFRKQVESECSTLRSQQLEYCATSGQDWLVHWMETFAGVDQQGFYCKAGAVAGTSEITICDGAGACASDAPVNLRELSVDRVCKNTQTGLDVQFVCNVLCTSCRERMCGRT